MSHSLELVTRTVRHSTSKHKTQKFFKQFIIIIFVMSMNVVNCEYHWIIALFGSLVFHNLYLFKVRINIAYTRILPFAVFGYNLVKFFFYIICSPNVYHSVVNSQFGLADSECVCCMRWFCWLFFLLRFTFVVIKIVIECVTWALSTPQPVSFSICYWIGNSLTIIQQHFK